jgi:hypothetical protein
MTGAIIGRLSALSGAQCFLLCATTQQGKLFDVNARLSDSTCGSGAVDAKDSLSFQVRIERDDDTLTWQDVDTASTMQGSVDDDEAFVVAQSNAYVITNACSVRRHDRYTGNITSSGSTITKLEGEIVFDHSQATGYDCDSLIGAADGFEDLPCEVDYTFTAKPAN